MTSPHREDWKGVKARLVLMSVLDPLRWRFGASEHRHRLSPPIAEEELAAFELDEGASLRVDYRTFLSSVGNGGAGPHYGAPQRAR